ncbi:hypothetical protein [Elizabethkingia miricola]|uniref:hypothetical protein n=1 Tax=Elizabethkingia miricola TaxID=172045 RepID=UPI000C152FD8|nr:hypothetical protein [Elizabethkingia miricola]MDV3774546.1 hypothetical protein [Elizabethkingia anophelis]PSL88969.1 hypothetical protein C7V10_06520 [Elizabethkingia miricola]QHQ85798.1 hypothetical protein FE632_02880 [Elizabethkingia miricola]UIO97035.1 hypothetical protein LYZ41_02880 [Elizabethkingia miricola]WER13819.1 hypothetical protein P0M31_02895 [Elizabethkingia miricola]
MNENYKETASDLLIDKSIYLFENNIISKQEHQNNLVHILKNIPKIEFQEDYVKILKDILTIEPEKNDIKNMIDYILLIV